jgi:hypothetical protein
LNISGCRTCLNGHGKVVLEVCELLMFVGDLFPEQFILSLELYDLLGPVLLPKFGEQLFGLLGSVPALICLSLETLHIVHDYLALELMLLLFLAHTCVLRPQLVDRPRLILHNLFFLPNDRLHLRDLVLQLGLLLVQLLDKPVFVGK